jgi:transcriptional regulator with XRE-family HTH domain
VRKITTNRLDIGRNIRQARVDAGLTQAILSERLDVSQQMIQKYEHGHVAISLDRLRQIAKVLGCDTSTLLAEAKDQPRAKRLPERARPLTDMEKALLAEFGKLHELSRKRLAIQVLRAFTSPST